MSSLRPPAAVGSSDGSVGTARERAPREATAGPVRGTILVTGASSGIGAATVAALAARGHRVLAGVRRLEDAVPLMEASELVEPILLDITDPAAIEALGERLALEPHGLAGLVNNAGTISVGPIETIDAERWEAAIRVNVLGTINVTRAALPALLRAHGRVVNVSSPNGRVALPMFGPYAVSKFALEAFNDTLRREVAHLGVRVICVAPGPISTPIFDKGLADAVAVMAMASDEQHERYGAMAASAVKAASDAKNEGHTPEEAAAVIVRALTTRRPRTRYPMGVGNRAATILSRLLPDRAMDALIARIATGEKPDGRLQPEAVAVPETPGR